MEGLGSEGAPVLLRACSLEKWQDQTCPPATRLNSHLHPKENSQGLRVWQYFTAIKTVSSGARWAPVSISLPYILWAEHPWTGSLVSQSLTFSFSLKWEKIYLTFTSLWRFNIKMHINFPFLCVAYHLLSTQKCLQWRAPASMHTGFQGIPWGPLGGEDSIPLRSQDLRKSWNESLSQCSCYRSQTIWWADSDLFSETVLLLASVQFTRTIAHFSDILPSFTSSTFLVEAHF